MKRFIKLIILLSVLFSSCKEENTYYDYVNPFIGTGAHGHTFPGASMPFGMVQLSPDTRMGNWDACSGYHYSDSSIIGFSHTHLSGTGCIDLGDILVRPTTKFVSNILKNNKVKPTRFQHKNEVAKPGYYKVLLDEENIVCELTATPRVGIHRYSFPHGKKANILLDLSHQLENETIELAIESVTENEITGYRFSKGWADNQRLFFVARFSQPFSSSEMYINDEFVTTKAITSDNIKLALSWDNLNENQLEMHVGLSSVSIEGAKTNLYTEAPVFNFEKYKAQAKDTWLKQLSAIQVSGNSDREKKIFYTALYHSYLAPYIYNDVDGQYRGMDQKIYHTKSSNHYTTFSLWDTFRTWHPLMTLLNRQFVNDMINSLLANYQQTGELPIWPLWGSETGTMIGYHSVSVIADAWMKGIRDFDGELALEAMVASSKTSRKGNDLYREFGFIPADNKRESVSCLLEYAYDDWCIARFAESMGEKEIAQEYRQRAFNYQNVFDGNTSFFRGKKENGDWISPFNPFEVSRDMTEATAWQYRFFVPHDVQGLINLFGGKDKFIKALDDLFNVKSEVEGELSDISGLIGQYAHGNEPSHHMAYLYSYVGQPWKTQYWVNRLQTEMYDNTPNGISGNEDCGQMSAWHIMSSLGFYPVCPGSNQYILATPRFSEIKVTLENGKLLKIQTDKNPLEYIYIKSVSLNGNKLEKPYINHEQILAGGNLLFELCKKPVKNISYDAASLPFSLSKEKQVSVPYIKSNVGFFANSCNVEMGIATEGAEIYYTLDGGDPAKTSEKYGNPLTLEASTIIKMKAFKEGYKESPTTTINAKKAVFLPAIKGKKLKQNGLSYQYFEGTFNKVADLENKKPEEKGIINNFSLSLAQKEDHFGFKYETFIEIPTDGLYEFYTISDDGSILFVDDKKVVDNDGGHAAVKATGVVALREGVHRLNVSYFEDYEGNSLEVGMNSVGKPAHKFDDCELWY